MGPSEAEVVLLDVVRLALIARLDSREVEVEIASILISLDIARRCVYLPRAERIDTSRKGKVDMLVDNKVVAQTSDKEAS